MTTPIIGVTPAFDQETNSLRLITTYTDSILAAGGMPMLLPPTEDGEVLARYLSACDGFLLSGGVDIHPSLYGETPLNCGPFSPVRDTFETALLPLLLASGKPILAICRGMQMLNVSLGGSLYRDIDTQCVLGVSHRMPVPSDKTCHSVTPVSDTLLAALCGNAPFAVNSYHHQAIKQPGQGLAVAAHSEDGLIEAVYLPAARFVLGVQWHPERLYAVNEHAKALFAAFLDAARGAR